MIALTADALQTGLQTKTEKSCAGSQPYKKYQIMYQKWTYVLPQNSDDLGHHGQFKVFKFWSSTVRATSDFLWCPKFIAWNMWITSWKLTQLSPTDVLDFNQWDWNLFQQLWNSVIEQKYQCYLNSDFICKSFVPVMVSVTFVKVFVGKASYSINYKFSWNFVEKFSCKIYQWYFMLESSPVSIFSLLTG